jgi:hypothetical protein
MLNSYYLISIYRLYRAYCPCANLFYRHNNLDGVQAVESQVVGEVGVLLDLFPSSDY